MCQINTLRTFRWRHLLVKPEKTYAYTWYICKNVTFQVLTAVDMKSSIFCNITPCSPLKVNRHFVGTCGLQLQSRRISQTGDQREVGSKDSLTCLVLVSCLACSSDLKMEMTHPSETSADFQRTTRCYIAEDRTFQHRSK
jgi:hypothetical protein